jgi:L-asparaginase
MDLTGGRVVVFGLGGTIAMGGHAAGGVTPTLSAADLIAGVPGLAATGIDIQAVEFRRAASTNLDFDDIDQLAAAIEAAIADGAAGVVITQGTNTIEESSYLLDLRYAGEHPVVVTGAMRNPTLAGADGPANLLASVQVAAGREARGVGVVVVMADEIHAARRVRKTHTSSCATFQSPNGGPLGYLVEGHPCLLNRPPVRLVLPAGPVADGSGAAASIGFGPVQRPRVGLYVATFGDGGELLGDLDARLDGLVVAAMGPGHLPERLLDVVTAAAASMPVVLASRTGAGSVLTETYGFAGAESDLIARGLVPAGFLDPVKARLLLYSTLAIGAGRDEIMAAFAVAGGYQPAGRWPWRVIDAGSLPL